MLKRCLAILFILFPLVACADSSQFKEGQDYERITNATPSEDKTIRVYEFFNYECPWCFRFEDSIDAWLKTKPKGVEFIRVPVSFNKIMRHYTKVYFVAKALNVEDKITRPLFNAIHKDGKDLTSQKALAAFFLQYGVSAQDFDNAYNYSMGIDAKMKKAQELTAKFQIYGVPAMVVDGQYRTDTRMNKGDSKRMIAVVNYLIAKVRTKNKQ